MKDKLCVSERRMRILDLLRVNAQMTRLDLANEFNVSIDTIARDIIFLSRIAPIITKRGNNGGIYIESEYRQYSLYLTDIEEDCLRALLDIVDEHKKHIIRGIIIKFTRNTKFANQIP